jgi:GxxExxY protein
MDVNKITGIVLDACIKIHTVIGPGCFEKVYEETLNYELYERGLEVQRPSLMPICYERLLIQDAYRMDLLVEKKLIIE